MTTEAEDTYVPGWTTLVHAKAACSFGEPGVWRRSRRPHRARHGEDPANGTGQEIREQ